MDYIDLVLGAFLVLSGLASIFTGKIYSMGSSAAKYTEESLKKFSRPYGVSNLIVGGALIGSNLVGEKTVAIGGSSVKISIILVIAAFVIALVVYLASRKLLVKK